MKGGEIRSTCHAVALDQGGISDAIGLHITLPIAPLWSSEVGGSWRIYESDLEWSIGVNIDELLNFSYHFKRAQWGFLWGTVGFSSLSYQVPSSLCCTICCTHYPLPIPSALLHLLKDGRDPWHSSTLGTGIQQGVVGDGVARDAWTQEADARSSTMLYHKYP